MLDISKYFKRWLACPNCLNVESSSAHINRNSSGTSTHTHSWLPDSQPFTIPATHSFYSHQHHYFSIYIHFFKQSRLGGPWTCKLHISIFQEARNRAQTWPLWRTFSELSHIRISVVSEISYFKSRIWNGNDFSDACIIENLKSRASASFQSYSRQCSCSPQTGMWTC